MFTTYINRDVEYLEGTAYQELKTLIQKRLPHTHLTCLMGIQELIKNAWLMVSTTKSESIKLQALSLIESCYETKMNLMTDAGVINSALETLDKSKDKLQKLQTKDSVEDINQESNAQHTDTEEEHKDDKSKADNTIEEERMTEEVS
ncbi:MAG: hypothetical protein DLM72_08310 [Candidatus Nitrosopolaris wilkensis]|nr:MAG: hypothetical protein DLM72_08310 [Candidatus Nitrosopolaris wilkensis]